MKCEACKYALVFLYQIATTYFFGCSKCNKIFEYRKWWDKGEMAEKYEKINK